MPTRVPPRLTGFKLMCQDSVQKEAIAEECAVRLAALSKTDAMKKRLPVFATVRSIFWHNKSHPLIRVTP